MSKYTETNCLRRVSFRESESRGRHPDVSKDYFDIYSNDLGHQRLTNAPSGFYDFLGILAVDSHVVMESTGYYHQQLADFFINLSSCSLC